MISANRQRTREILSAANSSDPASRLCDFVLFGLIVANILAVIIESVPSIDTLYQGWFDAFEVFSVLIFSIEYALRLWSSVDDEAPQRPLIQRVRYMLSPMAIIDLIVILPFFLGFFIEVDLRFLRGARLLFLLKLSRYSKSLLMLHAVLKEEARPIGATLFILAVILVVTSGFAYLAEHKAQPEAFGSIPQAMWWAVITMTTVGYGDVTPVTTMGKLIAAGIGIIGIGMVALPAGLLASGFTAHLHGKLNNADPTPVAAPRKNGAGPENDCDVCPHCGARQK